MEDKASLTKKIEGDIPKLSLEQLTLLRRASEAFAGTVKTFWRLPESTLIQATGLDYFGNALIMHHATTSQAFKKDKFEAVMRDAANFQADLATFAVLSPANNPGSDIKIGNETFALKTQADQSIKRESLTLTKWMELGKGEWTDKISHLEGLRLQFLKHLTKYDRILVLRCLSDKAPYEYELLEIPKTLLEFSVTGTFRWAEQTKALRTGEAKPGYCDVPNPEAKGQTLYTLYFDGRGERKLHVKSLAVKYCTTHARWRFGAT